MRPTTLRDLVQYWRDMADELELDLEEENDEGTYKFAEGRINAYRKAALKLEEWVEANE